MYEVLDGADGVEGVKPLVLVVLPGLKDGK
jgi:hypothetical protein